MKFPHKNSSKNQNSKANEAPIHKSNKKVSSTIANGTHQSSKQRTTQKSHPTANPSHKGIKKHTRALEQQHETVNQANYDQQAENMDAYLNIGARSKQSKVRNTQNKQYDELLDQSGKGFKRQKNIYFLQNKKYQGKVDEAEDDEEEEYVDDEAEEDNIEDEDDGEEDSGDDEQANEYNDLNEQEQDDNASEQQDQQPQNNQIRKALTLLKQKRHSTSKLFTSQLQSIDAEDQANIQTTMKNKSKTSQTQYQQALQLKKVLEVYDKLVALRYGQQNQLQEIKRYPVMDESLEQPKYPPMSHQLFTASSELQSQMVQNLSQYLDLFNMLAKKTVGKQGVKLQNDSEDEDNTMKDQELQQSTQQISLAQLITAENPINIDQGESAPARLNVDKLYTFIKQQISPQVSKVETELIKWSQKTSFLTPSSSTQLKSLLMQTPVGQAKKVMQNWQRLASKCQQKRGRQMFKILFEDEDNIHELSHPEIYDDYDLFIELEKYYLERLDDENEDGEFLQSATMKYLKGRQAKQLEHQKKQKQVDRKASKNRKIRYNVHTKLLNFMPCVPENVIETRDEIVRNIFNCNAKINEQAMEGNVAKYRSAQHHDDTELIDVE